MSEDTEGFEPVVLSINPITRVENERDLVIRLDLNYVEYAALEDLVALGVEALSQRSIELHKLVEEARRGAEPFPPLMVSDFELVQYRAAERHRDAQTLFRKIKRPPR